MWKVFEGVLNDIIKGKTGYDEVVLKDMRKRLLKQTSTCFYTTIRCNQHPYTEEIQEMIKKESTTIPTAFTDQTRMACGPSNT
jgi:glutaredoxin